MKTIFYSALLCLLLISCKKQAPTLPQTQPSSVYYSLYSGYLKNARAHLRKNMADSSFMSLDWNQVLLSNEASAWYLRLGYAGQSIAERFLLLTTDSLGNVSDAREVKLNKDPLIDWAFNGTIDLSDLQGRLISSNRVTNGYMADDRVRQPGTASVNSVEDMMLIPAGSVEELPEVIVVGYTSGALGLNDYLMLSALSGAGGASGGGASSGGSGVGSTGSGNSSGAGGASVPANSGQYSLLRPAGGTGTPVTRIISSRPTTITIDDSYSKPGINIAAYMRCFSAVPDPGAVYSMSLFVDLPVNDDPTQVFNQASGAVGHCFLGLTKSGSGQSITQYFGFCPTEAMVAIVGTVTAGKVVDNGGHKYNAYLGITLNAGQFATAMSKIISLSGSNYDLINFNCVDFSLSVINSFQPTTPIIPETVQMPAAGLSIDTPQGLYLTLQHIQNTGGAAVTGSIWNAGVSHGACN